MKKAINYSSDFMRSIDLDNATYEQEGLKMLEAPDSEFKLIVHGTQAPQNKLGQIDTSYYNDLLK
jgi:hypothetical protein